MRKLLFVILSILLLSCSEDGSDCFKAQGELETLEIPVGEFSKINISTGIELIVKESEEQWVRVTMGKNLINDLKF